MAATRTTDAIAKFSSRCFAAADPVRFCIYCLLFAWFHDLQHNWNICAYRNAALIGTECMIIHIIPISTFDPPSIFANFDNIDTLPWLKIKDFHAWREGQAYDVYEWFAADDNVPLGVQYVIVHDCQEINTLPKNEYVHALKNLTVSILYTFSLDVIQQIL